MSRDMRLVGAAAVLALALGIAGGTAHSEDKPPVGETPMKPDETLKERLSDKASDEQRVDNCKVPLDRRGPKARPEGCKLDDARAAPLKQP